MADTGKITLDECLKFLGIESNEDVSSIVQSLMDGIYSSLYISTGYDVSAKYNDTRVEQLVNTIVKLELYNDFNNTNVRENRINYLIKQLQVLMCTIDAVVETEEA